MTIQLIFKIAAVGILVTILTQVLKHSGRDEQAFLVSLSGLFIVLSWIIPCINDLFDQIYSCLLYTSPSPRDRTRSRMPSSA